MNVKVLEVRADSADHSLVFGVADDGRPVAFHLPRKQGDHVARLVASGEEVEVEIPDVPSPPPLVN